METDMEWSQSQEEPSLRTEGASWRWSMLADELVNSLISLQQTPSHATNLVNFLWPADACLLLERVRTRLAH